MLLAEQKLQRIIPNRVVERTRRCAGFDAFVAYRRSKYSVPPAAAGRESVVEDSGRIITLRLGDMIVARHDASARLGLEIARP